MLQEYDQNFLQKFFFGFLQECFQKFRKIFFQEFHQGISRNNSKISSKRYNSRRSFFKEIIPEICTEIPLQFYLEFSFTKSEITPEPIPLHFSRAVLRNASIYTYTGFTISFRYCFNKSFKKYFIQIFSDSSRIFIRFSEFCLPISSGSFSKIFVHIQKLYKKLFCVSLQRYLQGNISKIPLENPPKDLWEIY